MSESGQVSTTREVQACTDQIREMVLSRLNHAVAGKLVSSVDILRDSYTGERRAQPGPLVLVCASLCLSVYGQQWCVCGCLSLSLSLSLCLCIFSHPRSLSFSIRLSLSLYLFLSLYPSGLSIHCSNISLPLPLSPFFLMGINRISRCTQLFKTMFMAIVLYLSLILIS